VYLRDKAVLFNAGRTAFLTYSVQGRTWVALGDPVGPDEAGPGLIRLFVERGDDFGGVPVFYEVTRTRLHCYADFGLAFVKLGEEARVDLRALTWEGRHGARLRQALRRLEKEKATFEVLEPSAVPAVVAELREVSDDWLAAKTGGEKGFSLGFFDADYLARFPVAVIRRGGRIEAFANLWRSADHVELSIDLMRYRSGAPNGVMETLLAQLMKWGQGEGFQWFALGMAPLSGFERSPAASLWNRLGAFVFEHGGAVYNFQGLRAFKERFDPVWEPRYLVYPGGMKLPRILADVSALVAGGYHRLLR
jgi:phosphatidylglycerol lysyltransferase